MTIEKCVSVGAASIVGLLSGLTVVVCTVAHLRKVAHGWRRGKSTSDDWGAIGV